MRSVRKYRLSDRIAPGQEIVRSISLLRLRGNGFSRENCQRVTYWLSVMTESSLCYVTRRHSGVWSNTKISAAVMSGASTTTMP
jgi:hypothetical protein